jgi:anti-anti-sigma factor
MICRVLVLRAPAAIDITTSGELRAVLLQWHSHGHSTVVVDLTGTEFCDLAGLHELTRAHQRAVADGGGLRLVTPAHGPFPRIFTLTGLDGIIPHFATVEEALAQLPVTSAGSLHCRRGPVQGPGSLRRHPPGEAEAAPARPPVPARERGGVDTGRRACE